jgi:hypothetical protein
MLYVAVDGKENVSNFWRNEIKKDNEGRQKGMGIGRKGKR